MLIPNIFAVFSCFSELWWLTKTWCNFWSRWSFHLNQPKVKSFFWYLFDAFFHFGIVFTMSQGWSCWKSSILFPFFLCVYERYTNYIHTDNAQTYCCVAHKIWKRYNNFKAGKVSFFGFFCTCILGRFIRIHTPPYIYTNNVSRAIYFVRSITYGQSHHIFLSTFDCTVTFSDFSAFSHDCTVNQQRAMFC